MNIRYHIFFYGKVQGVFFRAYTRDTASKLGIKGWVKNLPDGSVEAVMEGKRNDVNALLDFCIHGHPYAKVERYDKKEEEYVGDFTEFTINID